MTNDNNTDQVENGQHLLKNNHHRKEGVERNAHDDDDGDDDEKDEDEAGNKNKPQVRYQLEHFQGICFERIDCATLLRTHSEMIRPRRLVIAREIHQK